MRTGPAVMWTLSLAVATACAATPRGADVVGRPQPTQPEAEPIPPAARTQDARTASVASEMWRVSEGVTRCYEDLLAGDESLSGRVLVQFEVTEGGAVRNVSIAENTSSSEALGACARDAVSMLRFAPGGTSATFRYPFVFTPDPSELPSIEAPPRMRTFAPVALCEQQARGLAPRLAGSVLLELIWLADGSLTNVEVVHNTTGSDRLAGCLRAAIPRFRMNRGPPPGEPKFRIDFRFAPAAP